MAEKILTSEDKQLLRKLGFKKTFFVNWQIRKFWKQWHCEKDKAIRLFKDYPWYCKNCRGRYSETYLKKILLDIKRIVCKGTGFLS